MGKRYSRKNKGNSGPRKERDANTSSTYHELVRENAMLEEYYKAQKLVSEEEWPTFWNHLKVTLPTTFRITGTRSHAAEIRDTVKNAFVPHLRDISVDGVIADPPRPLAWYPDEFGWHFDVPRTLLKKSVEYAKFHSFLVAETEVGNISRQEAVSMIPPLLLDVKPQHWVMDMCAAPGSKTAQIIEMVHANDLPKQVPTGLILANDSDYKRSHMLIHQTKRLQSPCLMVTNHDATMMPTMKLAPNKEGESVPFEFDRVLADVPCSGDATLRKNPMVWKNWTHGGAMPLHQTQVNILQRGVQLLKVGGRIVYSTCSFNPMENEAVVAEILNRANGSLELVDVSHELPELKRRPGLSKWKVFTRDGKIVDKLEDVPADAGGKFSSSMWPPKNAADLHLERCLRIYPHLQDTGGFFVAVFKKTAPFVVPNPGRAAAAAVRAEQVKTPTETEEVSKEEATESTTDAIGSGDKHKLEGDEGEKEVVKKPRMSRAERFGVVRKEEPFLFLDNNNVDIQLISNFYGLDKEFPTDQFLVRSEGEKNKTIYFVSEAVKSILQSEEIHRLKVVNTGVRTFIRQDTKTPTDCSFRVNSEGIGMMRQFFSSARVLSVQLPELTILLQNPYPKTSQFAEALQETLTNWPSGCCLFEFDPALEPNKDEPNPRWEGQGITGFVKGKMVFPVWKANVSFNLLLNKEERRSLAMRLGIDCVDAPHVIEGGAKGTAAKAAEATDDSTPASEDVSVEASPMPVDEVEPEADA